MNTIHYLTRQNIFLAQNARKERKGLGGLEETTIQASAGHILRLRLFHRISKHLARYISVYHLVATTRAATCYNRAKTMSECEEAARQTGLSDVTAEDDGQNNGHWGQSYFPPYCYFQGGRLKFNSGGTNTGPCTSINKCLCYAISCS